MSEEKVYSAEEVSKHNDRDDLWMVINGKVYDVTKFVDEHPGGEEVLVDVAGADATSEFEDVGHSEDAEEILSGLLVGKADEKDFAAKKAGSSSAAFATNDSGESAGSSSFVYLVVAAVVAAGAYFYLV